MDETEEEISLLDYLGVLVRWRWMIVKLVAGACLVAAVVSLLLPEAYTARATLLPPEERSSSSGLSALLGRTGLPLAGLGIPAISNKSELFVQILESRSVLEPVVEKFGLDRVYRVRNKEDAIKEFRKKKLRVKAEKAGVISIAVEAPSPDLAANMANALVDELDRFNRENNTTAAKNTRIFIERRLDEAKQDLSGALTALQAFQERNQLISLDEQAKAAVKAGAELASRLQLLEFELAVKQKTLSSTHPEVTQLHIQIKELRNQLNKMRVGNERPAKLSADPSPGRTDFNLPFTRVPALQHQLGQLMMDAKVQQSIVEILLQQYEQAKIQEVRDTPTVRRLDAAVPPPRRSKPQRTLMVLMTGMVAFFMGVTFAFVLEYGQKAVRDGDKSDKAEAMIASFQADYSRIRKIFNGKRPDSSSSPPAVTASPSSSEQRSDPDAP